MTEQTQQSQANPLSHQPGGSHYKRLAYQPIEFSMENRLDPCAFSLLRYAARIGPEGKNQDILDLEKILHYLDLRQYFRSLRLPGTAPRQEGLRIPMSRFSSQEGIDPTSARLLLLLAEYLEDEAKAQALRNEAQALLADYQAAAEAEAKAKAKETRRAKNKDTDNSNH